MAGSSLEPVYVIYWKPGYGVVILAHWQWFAESLWKEGAIWDKHRSISIWRSQEVDGFLGYFSHRDISWLIGHSIANAFDKGNRMKNQKIRANSGSPFIWWVGTLFIHLLLYSKSMHYNLSIYRFWSSCYLVL